MLDTDSKRNNKIFDLFGFTIDEYKRLLTKAKSKFHFVGFTENELSSGQIILRHDIDRSPVSALEIAKINKSLGISATFFVRTKSENYNFLDPTIQDILNQITELGQILGLHLEPTERDLIDDLSLEKAITLQKQLWGIVRNSSEIKTFAFHNTSSESLKFTKQEYAGLFNAYSEKYKINGYYTSDSGGKWRFRDLDSVLDDVSIDRLQLLIHTDWWRKKDSPPFSKIHISAMEDFERTINKYLLDLENANLQVDRGSAALIPHDYSTAIGLEPGIIEFLWNMRKFKTIHRILTSTNSELNFSKFPVDDLEKKCLKLL